MDIALVSMALSQAKLQQQAGIAVMRKVMDSAEQNGAAMVKLLESSGVNGSELAEAPYLGANIDIRV